MRRPIGVLAFVFFVSSYFCAPSYAQVATGTPPYGSFTGGPDVINLGNLNAQLSIPIMNKAGRGMPFTYTLTYDTSVFYPVTSSGTTTWTPVYNWGWNAQTSAATGYISYTTSSYTCYYLSGKLRLPATTELTTTNFIYHDQWGIPHPFTGSVTEWSGDPEPGCPLGTDHGISNTTADGSGYSISASTPGSVTITTRNGKVIKPPAGVGSGSGTATDSNGNEITVNASGVFEDTLGTNPTLTVTGVAPSNTTFAYTAPSGATVEYTMVYGSYTVQTNFGCTSPQDYPATVINLVSEIDLPDVGVNPTDKYVFHYEATPSFPGKVTGRLASVTLPTGGTITYAYTGANNGIECSDGSAAGLNRTTPDGMWTYARSGSGTAWTTTMTDPQSNQTTINFQSVLPTAGPPVEFYETERQVYQGATTLLKTTLTCYNAATPNCNSTVITQPISQISTYVEWLGPPVIESRKDNFYDGYGNNTELDEYAYGTGAPGAIVRKQTITYWTTLSNGIVGKPHVVTVENGSNTVKSQTTYTYDETGVTGTSAPQHTAISGSRGNLTTMSSLVGGGAAALTKTYTYYDTGMVNVATDVNLAQTTYTYGTGSCGNAFPTSIAEPIGLSRSLTWNCTGGVQLSITDENGNTPSATWSDGYFWRPYKVSDAQGFFTTFSYTPTTVESAMLFNSNNSTTDVLTTYDELGRISLSQHKEGPSSIHYDTVETDFDGDGRPSRKTLPFYATAGASSLSAPGTSTTYDALGRPLLMTSSGVGGESVAYSYPDNDSYISVGPAPTGENAKRKQSEVDALGRLSSVCEVTSLTGSGTCGQISPQTGYWTEYGYDVLDDLTSVTQNAQSSGSQQTRSYSYDGLGRLTSESNPESGTTTYKYDADATCGTAAGDLVKKVDSVGNTICYAYDALHRVTGVTFSGPYASSTPSKHFVYDVATVNSAVMAQPKTRMVEAYTCNSPCTSKLTDIGLSYSKRGEVVDTYESTPNSGAYYHVTSSYDGNHAEKSISNLTGLPTLTIGLDGEGRNYSVSASSGQNPLTSATYNTDSEPVAITFGSGDNDQYTYDPNTFRMTQYQFNVNSQSDTGVLTWNAIGTLKSLAITDPFFSSGTMTCSLAHDDLSRISSANCGTPWAQTFSYDPFGNISKSGSITFQPTYSYLTNRMTQIGSTPVTYDANGNVSSDTAHTYSWDANGRPVTIDSVSLAYDALGRVVEQNSSGVYTQVVYAPGGSKLALMSGSSLQKAFVPLAGGTSVVYGGTGIQYYRNSDWQGSYRLGSTTSRTIYWDGAFAPFGEIISQSNYTDPSYTGMNQDTVSNLFDFPAREFNPIHGRWASPDPAGLAAAQPGTPQTLNRYAYVDNGPTNFTDPTGLILKACMWDETGNEFAKYGKNMQVYLAKEKEAYEQCFAKQAAGTPFPIDSDTTAFNPWDGKPGSNTVTGTVENIIGETNYNWVGSSTDPYWSSYTDPSSVMGSAGLGIDTSQFDPNDVSPLVSPVTSTNTSIKGVQSAVPLSGYPLALNGSAWNAASSADYGGDYSGTGATNQQVTKWNPIVSWSLYVPPINCCSVPIVAIQ